MCKSCFTMQGQRNTVNGPPQWRRTLGGPIKVQPTTFLLVVCLLTASLIGQVSEPIPDVPRLAENELNQKLESISNIYRRDGEYRLGGGDLIEVSVYGVAEFKHELRINSSGLMTLVKTMEGPPSPSSATLEKEPRSFLSLRC